MLYEMVTGRPPFLGSDSIAVISQHINTAPIAPSWHIDHCPPDLEELILRLLSKDPKQRPDSALEAPGVMERIDPTQKSAAHDGTGENPLDLFARGVFVGRERELERLRAAFDEAVSARGNMRMPVGSLNGLA